MDNTYKEGWLDGYIEGLRTSSKLINEKISKATNQRIKERPEQYRDL
jgi:hypothetical protein